MKTSTISDNNPFVLSNRQGLMGLNGYPMFASLVKGGLVVAESLGINHCYSLSSTRTSVWGCLVTLGSFTPNNDSETFTITARVTPA